MSQLFGASITAVTLQRFMDSSIELFVKALMP